MDVYMFVAKAGSFLLLLMLSAGAITGCGIEVKDESDAEAEGSEANELSALLDGDGGLELETRAVNCERSDDLMVIDFDGDQSGEADAAGVSLRLEVAGELDEGDALTPDNSSLDQFFDFRMLTTEGKGTASGSHATSYRYVSLPAAASAHGPTYAALTVLEDGDFTTRLRLWIEGLAPVSGGSPRPNAAGFRATFTCNRWD